MTAVSAPYTLLRRDGEARLSQPVPAGERHFGLRRSEVTDLLAERRFAMAYQPVWRLSDRSPVAQEALLRPRAKAGMPVPCTRNVLAAAQAWGVGAALDLAVLETVLAEPALAGGVPVSVNIAAASLQDPVCFARLSGMLGGAGARVMIEITGIAALDDLPAVAAGVAALQAAGVRVAFDDLGTDDVSLACVRVVRFDQLKIAGNVLRAAAAGERGRALLRLLVALAAAAGSETVAKLVETLPQCWLAQDLGIGLGQGWLFGAPGKRL